MISYNEIGFEIGFKKAEIKNPDNDAGFWNGTVVNEARDSLSIRIIMNIVDKKTMLESGFSEAQEKIQAAMHTGLVSILEKI